MKSISLLFILGGAIFLGGCTTVIDRRPHRAVVIEQRDPYRRVYARDLRGRTYYRRAYYSGGVQTRFETQRYYDTRPGPIDRSYGF